MGEGEFWFRGRHGIGLRQYADLRETPQVLRSGTWAVAAEFDGPWHAWEVESVHECDTKDTCVIPVTAVQPGRPWVAPVTSHWRSSLDQEEYEERVRIIHDLIDQGPLAQVNLCRILSADCTVPPPAREVFHQLAARHPAPYSGWFDFTGELGPPLWLVSASPELAFDVSGGVLQSAPIKGTAPSADELLPKDFAENELVTEELLRHLSDLVDEPRVVRSREIEQHPGLVQLVSTIEGRLPDDRLTWQNWSQLLEVIMPPLSVAGVPRPVAHQVIARLEPVARGPYCGAVGWIDADRAEATLGAMIRSFWWGEGALKFGTGAGITRDSDPEGEWEETELKARRLLRLLKEVSD